MRKRLNASDYEALSARWIPAELADQAALYRVTASQASDMLGRKTGDFAGVVIPYRRPGTDRIHAYRIRRDKPDVEFDAAGNPKEKQKYMQPPRQHNVCYYPPGAPAEALTDHTVPIVITEGEFKTLALWRLANHDSAAPMFLPIGLGGVWNWRGVVGRTDNARGERVAVKGLIPDLAAITWKGRKVAIAYDSDASRNEQVAAARRLLTAELHKRMARVAWLEWAADTTQWKNAKGIDDLLAAIGPEKVLELYQRLIYRNRNVTDDSPFQLTENGVLYVDRSAPDRPPSRICGKLQILAKTRDTHGEDWGRLLEWVDDDGNSHRAAMPMTALGGDGSECRDRLLHGGLYISPSPKARSLLSTYISTYPVEARTTCVDRIGWHGAAFVLPTRAMGAAHDELILQTAREFDHSIMTRGSLDEWRAQVASQAAGNSRIVFSISAAFAGPLLMPCGVESGGVHFYGSSSTGKSTTLFAGGSVIGGNERSGFVQSWRNTTNGLEAIAEAHNDLALFLDELAQIDPSDAADIAYMLGNGSGKGRMTKSIATRRKLQWCLIFVSSGEITLADHAASAGRTTKAGAEIRLLNIPADAGAGMGIFEVLHKHRSPKLLAQHLQGAARACYGTALPPYLEYLCKHRDAIAGAVKEGRARFAREYTPRECSGEIHRAVDRFALIGAAGELASKIGITGWQEGEATEAARRCLAAWLSLRGSTTGGDEEAGIRQVRHFIERHESRFQHWNGDGPPCHNRAGFRRLGDDGSTIYYILPEVFQREVCATFDHRAVAKALIDRGHITKYETGRETVKPHVPAIGAKPRLYQIESSILEA